MKALVTLTLKEDIKPFFPPKYPDVYAHHVTLAYNPDTLELWESMEGKEVKIHVTSECFNQDIQAVEVVLPPEVVCLNTHPHITISANPGTAPVKSNSMLQNPVVKSRCKHAFSFMSTLVIERR